MIQLKSYIISSWLIILTTFFIACPEAVEDPDPPERPVMVTKSLPESWHETGIDADNTGSSRIVVMWHPNTEDDLAGYVIYRADTLTENGFREIATIDLFNVFGADTVFFDDSLYYWINYFYFICALDNSDNLSQPSDTVTYRLIRAPQGLIPRDTTIVGSFQFYWMDRAANYEYSTEYVIRLDNLEMGQTVWIARFTNVWYGFENSEPIPFSFFNGDDSRPTNLLSHAELYTELPSGIYRWKVKAISEVDNTSGLDEASGESEWLYFNIE